MNTTQTAIRDFLLKGIPMILVAPGERKSYRS